MKIGIFNIYEFIDFPKSQKFQYWTSLTLWAAQNYFLINHFPIKITFIIRDFILILDIRFSIHHRYNAGKWISNTAISMCWLPKEINLQLVINTVLAAISFGYLANGLSASFWRNVVYRNEYFVILYGHGQWCKIPMSLKP